MKSKTSRILIKSASLVIALIIGISALVCASAINFDVNEAPGITDNEALISYIHDTLLDRMLNWDGSTLPEIDISSFNIEYTTANFNARSKAISHIFVHCSPETFMNLGCEVKESGSRVYCRVTAVSGFLTKIKVAAPFLNSADQFKAKMEKCQQAADKLLDGIKGSSLSDVEKALLIHDRLALLLSYDESLTAADNDNIYGALVKNVCICEGYTNAYEYLLSQVGITSTHCSSNTLRHEWNIVILNGKKYHVDVTFDDSLPDIEGRVLHRYFLKSTGFLQNDSDHKAPDFTDTTPTDTTYDNWFIENSAASAQIVDGTIYYVDNINSALMKITGTGSTKVKDLGSAWLISEKIGGKETKTFSRLATDGNYLYYAKTDGLYKYDPTTNTEEKIKSYSNAVVGFTYDGAEFTVETYSSGSYKTEKFAYTAPAPAEKEYTAKFISDGTTLSEKKLKEGAAIAKPANPSKSGYTFKGWSPEVPDKMPAKDMTFTALFEKNPSDPAATLYTVKFTVDGTVIKQEKLEEGDAISKPANPSKSGYTFKGWNPEVPAKMPAKDMTFAAKFEKDAVTPGETDISKVTISAPSGKKTINWKYRAQLTATASLPSGYRVLWFENGKKVSDSGEFTTGNLTETHTYTARIVDSSNKVVSKESQEKTVTIEVKSDFFTKIISFFSRLFGSDITKIN